MRPPVAATGHAVAQTIERKESPTDDPKVLNFHWSTSEVTCSTHLTEGEYRLVEVSSDLLLGRPRTVTLAHENGALYTLIAADDLPDLKPALNGHFGRE